MRTIAKKSYHQIVTFYLVSIGTWDSKSWKLNLVINSKDKCVISFIKYSPTSQELMMNLLASNPDTNNIESHLKIIRDESIGEYSWDSSDESINTGYGINEWSTSDMVSVLNNGPYWNKTSG